VAFDTTQRYNLSISMAAPQPCLSHTKPGSDSWKYNNNRHFGSGRAEQNVRGNMTDRAFIRRRRPQSATGIAAPLYGFARSKYTD